MTARGVGTSDADGWLYAGKVMHHRLRPFRHRFVYSVFSLLVDIDRLDALDRRLRLLAVDRPNLVSLQVRDHGSRDGAPLRAWVDQELARQGMPPPGGRVLLLCYPRLLGYVFNPLSIYYCHAPDGGLRAVLYEVRNTFGEQHAYVLPVCPEDAATGAVRQSCAKAFHVSPFIGMDRRYHFKLAPPGGRRLSVLIQEESRDGVQLATSFTAIRRPLEDSELLRMLIRQPLMTYKVIAGIHFEALRLWRKGARLHPRPHHALSDPPAP